MKKLLTIRLGGGRVQSGLLPVEALALIKDLLGAMSEEGGDPDAWKRADAHIEIVGKASTSAGLWSSEYHELIGPAEVFVLKADQRNLGPKGLEFVDKRFRTDQPWEWAEIATVNHVSQTVRFDPAYREAIREEHRIIRGNDEFFARVIRVGGDERVTAKLEIGGVSGTHAVASREVARKLAARLFETVRIEANVEWDSRSLEIVKLTVTAVDESWRDVHLAQLIAQHGGVLPLQLSVKSTTELLAERGRIRDDN